MLDFDLEVQTRFGAFFVKLVVTDKTSQLLHEPKGFYFSGNGKTLDLAIDSAKNLFKWYFVKKGMDLPQCKIVSVTDKGEKLSGQEYWLKSHREKGGEMPTEVLFEW